MRETLFLTRYSSLLQGTHLKKPLQPSQVIALKWKPVARSPHTPQIRGTFRSKSPGSGKEVLAAVASMAARTAGGDEAAGSPSARSSAKSSCPQGPGLSGILGALALWFRVPPAHPPGLPATSRSGSPQTGWSTSAGGAVAMLMAWPGVKARRTRGWCLRAGLLWVRAPASLRPTVLI